MSKPPTLENRPTPTPRLLPAAPEAERGALSSFLQAPREIGSLCAERGVTPGHFHLPAHAVIYQSLMELWEAQQPIDFITFTGFLRDRALLDAAGGPAAVTDLFTYLPTAANAGYYLETLQEKFTLREIIKSCTQFITRSYEEQEDPAALLDEFEAVILAIRRSDTAELQEREPNDLIKSAVTEIERQYQHRGEISGQATGLDTLDQTTDGLHPGQMVVIAARPSMGKTALAMTIAERVAVHDKKTVAVFTLEMSDHELMKRALLSRARVNLHRVRLGFVEDRDFPAITEAAIELSNKKLRIVDAIGATIGAIRAKARRMARQHPDLALIIVDYLQLVRGTSKQAQTNREREIAEVSQGLKWLARELKLPVLVLAQLNRDVEKRTGGETRGRPRLSDLRESGAIEQDADLVGLLYREEMYAETECDKREVEGKATLIIAKQRNGPPGDVDLTFLKEFARYEATEGRQIATNALS